MILWFLGATAAGLAAANFATSAMSWHGCNRDPRAPDAVEHTTRHVTTVLLWGVFLSVSLLWILGVRP